MRNTSKQYQYLALTCENDIVSVLQEFPGLPIPKIHRLCSLPTQLQHAAIRVGRLGTKKFDTYVCMKKVPGTLRTKYTFKSIFPQILPQINLSLLHYLFA